MVVHGSRQDYFPDTGLRVADRSQGCHGEEVAIQGPGRAEITS